MVVKGRMVFGSSLLSLILLLGFGRAHAQIQPAQPQPSQPAGGTIHGVVKSGNMPIPGASILISVTSSDQKIFATTDVDGSYSATVPSFSLYTVRVQMVAFADSTQQVVVDASHQSVSANFVLTLLSRTHEASPPPRRPNGPAVAQRSFQTLSALQNMSAPDAGGNSMSDVVPSGMPVPGVDPNSATESIAVSGNSSNPLNAMSGDELQQRINDARQQGAGFGGGFGGPGGFGGGGPGRAMTLGGRRGFDVNHPHGSIYYGVGDSALNAAPYALAGEPATNPAYLQNSFGGSIGGPLNIPKIYHGGTKTFFFVNFNGHHGENPFDQFSTVPTLRERRGDFSQTTYTSGAKAGQPVELFNSTNNTPYTGNIIPRIRFTKLPLDRAVQRCCGIAASIFPARTCRATITKTSIS